METSGGDWEQKVNLINELTEGMELAKQLQMHLNVTTTTSSLSNEKRESLELRILNSYDKALSMLKWNGSIVGDQPQWSTTVGETAIGWSKSPPSFTGSPHSEDSDLEFKANEHKNGSRKSESAVPQWTKLVQICPGTGLEGPLGDGFSWRKYGQKDVLGAKYPRAYYRCTHKFVRGCLATKQVQRSDEDPTVFEITYRGRHTCTSAAASHLAPPPSTPEKQEPNYTPLFIQLPQQHQPQHSLDILTGLTAMTEERKAFDATNNRAHLIEDDQSGPTVSNLEKETMREASRRKCITKSVLISEDLRQHYGGGQRDAEKSLGDSLVRNSYDKALSMLKWNGSIVGDQPQWSTTIGETAIGWSKSPPSFTGSPHSEDSDLEFKAHEHKNGSRKSKSAVPQWTKLVQICPGTGLEGPLGDGFSWRKYGQKDVFGAKYPRAYYRCTHRNVWGCLATKQVQRSDEDPTVFEITYRGRHTCTSAAASHLAPSPSTPEKQEPNTALNIQLPQQHHQQHSLDFQTGLRAMTKERKAFDATNNRAHLIEDDQSGPTVSNLEKETMSEASKRKCITKSVLISEDLRQHYGGGQRDAEKSLGDSLVWNSLEVLDVLPLWEESNTIEHLVPRRRLALQQRWIRPKKSLDLPRTLQMNCTGGLTVEGNSFGRERPVEVISVSTEEKLISRLQFLRMSLLGRSSLRPLALPSGSEFPGHIAFSSSELTSTNNRAYPGRQDQCSSSASRIEKERTREMLYGEGTASHVFSFEHVQQHFGSKRENDSKIFGVCLSTFTRITRHHGIRRWPNQIRNNVWRSPDPHREKNLSPTFKMLSTNCPITMENDMGCQNLEPNELLPDSFGDLNFRNGENGSLAEIEKTPTFHDSFSGNCCEADICLSEYDKTQAAGGSFKLAFQLKGLTTQFIANPNLNTLVFPHPQIASTEVLSENMGSSEDGTKLLASHAEGFLEGDVSECSNLTFPLEGQSMQATACPNHNTLQLPQPLIALTQILNENMGSSEDWIASQQEPFLKGHISGSINLTVPTCSSPSPSQQPMPTTPYTMHRVLHMLPPLTSSLDASSVKIKATYRDTIIEFQLPLASGSIELKEEVAKILNLEIDSFNVRYKDEEGEGDWILIPCNKDFRNYLQLFSSLVNPVIRLLVVDKDANLTNLDPMALKQPAMFVESGIDPDSNGIVSDLLRFASEKEICKKAGKAWTRFYLLYEPPGADRLSLITDMANYLEFDICYLDLRSMSSIRELKNMLLSTPNRSLIAIQDIDHCAVMLPNLKNELTVSCLLKYVDGLFSRCGDERIIVFTNHRDRNDAALLPLVNMDNYIHVSSPQPMALPDGGEIVQLESSEQKSLLDCDATENEAHLLIAYQSCPVASLLENRNRGEALKRECITKSILGLEDLQQHSGGRRDNAAKSFATIYDPGIHMTNSLALKSFEEVETLRSSEQPSNATDTEREREIWTQMCLEQSDACGAHSIHMNTYARRFWAHLFLGLCHPVFACSIFWEPDDFVPSLSLRRLTLKYCVRKQKSPYLPRLLQIIAVEPGPTKSPRYSAGSFAKSGTPLHWSDVLPDGGQVVSLSDKEIVRKTLKRKCRTTKVRRLEYHQLHFDSRCQDAAKRHGAKRICRQHVINKVSTVKCIHRQHAIHWWPFRQKWAMMKVYSLEGQRPLEVISPSTGRKLVARLQVIHVSWLGRSSPGSSAIPGGGEILGFIALSSSGFAATNNRANLLGQNPSGSTASHSNKKRRRDAAVDKETNLYIGEQDLRQHFGLTREEAARRLGVSVTTLKRHCRKHGILRWPCNRNGSSDIPGRPPDPDERNTYPTCKASTHGQTEMDQMVDHLRNPNEVAPDLFDDIRAFLETPTSPADCAGNNVGMEVSVSSFLEEEIEAIGSYEAAFQPQEQMTMSFAYPTHNYPVCAQPYIASKEMISENTRSSNLTSQVDARLEWHDSGSSYLTVATCSNLASSQPMFTIPETRPTIPQPMSTISETRPTVPQPMSTIPDTGPSIPQPMSTIPETGLTVPQPMSTIPDTGPTIMTIKAKYRDSTIKFKLPLTSTLAELNEKVEMRLKLKPGSFDVEYKDEDQDDWNEGWILIACDEDLRDYLQLFSSLDNPVIKLLILDKVVNANESSWSFKRKRP